MDPFDPYSPFKNLILYSVVCLLFIGHKDYNNHSGAYVYSRYTKFYRHWLVYRCLLTTCLCGKAAVKANYVLCPATNSYSAYNWKINKLAR